MSEEIDVYCPRCAEYHKATASLDEHGYPHTAWSKRHDPDAVELAYRLAAIAEDGGKALALVLDAGDWSKADLTTSPLALVVQALPESSQETVTVPSSAVETERPPSSL